MLYEVITGYREGRLHPVAPAARRPLGYRQGPHPRRPLLDPLDVLRAGPLGPIEREPERESDRDEVARPAGSYNFV